MSARRWGWLAALAAAVPSATALAQDTVVILPRERRPSASQGIEQWAVDRFNASGTTAVFGSYTLAAGERLTGDLAVVDGPVVVRGTVDGDLVAINADVTLAAGAVVTGDVVILGGVLDESPDARVDGTLRIQSHRPEVRRVGNRLELERRPSFPVRTNPTRRHTSYFNRNRGNAFLVLGLGGTYNRVEGLPARLGVGLEWENGDLEARLRAFGIVRSAGDFKTTREDLGYQVDGQLRVGYRPRLTLGGRAFDLVVPTQEWPLTLHEVGWASLLFHRDYRDYFLQRGFAGFLEFSPARGITLTGEAARVTEGPIAERDPWTPFRNSELWRPNPLVDQGDFTLFSGTLEFDSRPSIDADGSGVLVRGTFEHGIGDNVVARALPLTIRPPLPPADYTFDRVSGDLRLYQRIGWDGQLRLRAFYAGSVGRDPLPIQRRFSLGGPDPMNGYGFRDIACNAGVADPALPGLCDHVLLFQAQYRGSFGLDWIDFDHRAAPRRRARENGDRRWWHGDFDWGWENWFDFEGPNFVLFGDGGTGWLEGDATIPDLRWDIGAGIEWGSVGLYLAKALREGEPVRVTFRVERRF